MSYEAPSADAISATGESYTAPDADNIVAEGGVSVAKLSTVASSLSESDSALKKAKNVSFGVSTDAVETLKTLNSENIGTEADTSNVAVGSVSVTAKIGSIIDSTSISSAIETAKASFAEIEANKSSVSEQTDVLATKIAPLDAFSGVKTTTKSQREWGTTRASVSAELLSITRRAGSGAVPSYVSSSALSRWTTAATKLVSPQTRSVSETDSEIEYPESRDSLAETKLTGTFGVAPESATVSFLLEEPLGAITNSPKSRTLPLSISSTSSESLGTDNSGSVLLLVSGDTIITALIERELQTITSLGNAKNDSNTEALSAYSVPSTVDYKLKARSDSDPMGATAVAVKADSNTEVSLRLPRSLFVDANSESRPLVFLKLYGDSIVQPQGNIRPKYALRRGRVKQKTAAGDSIRYGRTASATYHSNSGEIEYDKGSGQK